MRRRIVARSPHVVRERFHLGRKRAVHAQKHGKCARRSGQPSLVVQHNALTILADDLNYTQQTLSRFVYKF